jgi:DNA-directed RNA polymerase subunit L
MEIKILSEEKNSIELDFGSVDQSLAQYLAEKLNADKDVEFAACKVDHPIIGYPRLILRTKKGDPKKIVLEKLEEIRKEVVEFKTKFVQISK